MKNLIIITLLTLLVTSCSQKKDATRHIMVSIDYQANWSLMPKEEELSPNLWEIPAYDQDGNIYSILYRSFGSSVYLFEKREMFKQGMIQDSSFIFKITKRTEGEWVIYADGM